MLNLAVRNTRKMIRAKSKEENVRIGRTFTKKPTAALMASMLDFTGKTQVSILDPGAGTGILSAAAVEAACRGGCKEIHLTCYETDAEMAAMLKDNLKRIRRKCHHDYAAKLIFRVEEEDFVLSLRDAIEPSLLSALTPTYDVVIMNPPSTLCEKDSSYVKGFGALCAGETDMAHLFALVGSACLAEGGRMVALLPTTYAYAYYLDRIRRRIGESCRIEGMHLFLRSSKIEGKSDVLRKTMLLSFQKRAAAEGDKIALSVSADEGEDLQILPEQPYGNVVQEDGSLLLIKSTYDLDMLRYMSRMPNTLSSLGLEMHTGLTLDSRYPDCLRDTPMEGAIPLIHPACVGLGLVQFPLKEKNQYIIPKIPSLAQKNKNMLFVKRVPAKSDRRRLMCAVYLASQLPRNRYISTHNKLNYIDYKDGRELDPALLYGLFALFTCDLYNDYCVLTSPTGSVNTTYFSSLPLPEERLIRSIGEKLLITRQLTPKTCTQLVYSALRISK